MMADPQIEPILNGNPLNGEANTGTVVTDINNGTVVTDITTENRNSNGRISNGLANGNISNNFSPNGGVHREATDDGLPDGRRANGVLNGANGVLNGGNEKIPIIVVDSDSGAENDDCAFYSSDKGNGLLPGKANGFGDTSFMSENSYSAHPSSPSSKLNPHPSLFAPDDSNRGRIRENLFLALSGVYGILLVILGAVVPVSETFVDSSPVAFEVFYIYLFSMSIAFFVYVYIYLLRRKRLEHTTIVRKLSKVGFPKQWSDRSFDDTPGTPDNAKPRRRSKKFAIDPHHHTGSFYLRAGAIAFGIGGMIHNGLTFSHFVIATQEGCAEAVQAVSSLCHALFTFSQMYFIFMNSKMCINRHLTLARFGLIHVAGTNICVWFRSIVVETLHVIHMQHHKAHAAEGHANSHEADSGENGYHVDYTELMKKQDYDVVHGVLGGDDGVISSLSRHRRAAATNSGGACEWNDLMGRVVESAGPYLFPCTIEYSLICAGILYVIWSNVGKDPTRHRHSSEDDEDDHSHHRMSVDCHGSSRGLFLGIMLFVGSIILMIAFYMLSAAEDRQRQAMTLIHVSETAIYVVAIFAIACAAFKMRDLKFTPEPAGLEDNLVLISFSGLYVFGIFSMVAAFFSNDPGLCSLTSISNLTMMIQATMQTVFILAGDRISANSSYNVRKKPGREFVTFLLLVNLTLWFVNTFTTQTPEHNPIQVEFYGPEAWALFTHISLPLGIFYRFHSTVSLSAVFKNAWKHRTHH